MQNRYFEGIRGLKIYPVALPNSYIIKMYRREFSFWGRLRNDIEHWLIKKILRG